MVFRFHVSCWECTLALTFTSEDQQMVGYQLDESNSLLDGKMGGNHHLHPFKNGLASGYQLHPKINQTC